MAALKDASKIQQIQDIVFNNGSEYFSDTELTHVCSMIIKEPTKQTLQEVSDYLKEFSGISFGHSTYTYNTSTTRGLSNNAVRIMLSDVSKVLFQEESGEEEKEETVSVTGISASASENKVTFTLTGTGIEESTEVDWSISIDEQDMELSGTGTSVELTESSDVDAYGSATSVVVSVTIGEYTSSEYDVKQ